MKMFYICIYVYVCCVYVCALYVYVHVCVNVCVYVCCGVWNICIYFDLLVAISFNDILEPLTASCFLPKDADAFALSTNNAICVAISPWKENQQHSMKTTFHFIMITYCDMT